MHREPARVWAAFVLLSLVWGSSYLCVSIALESFSPFAVAAIRELVAGASAIVLAATLGELRTSLRAMRTDPIGAGGIAVLGVLGSMTLLNLGQTLIPSGTAATLCSATPLFVALAAPIVLGGDRARPRQWLGLIISLAGVGIVVGTTALRTPEQALGAALVLLSAACYGGVAIILRARFSHLAPLAQASVYLMSGSVVAIPLLLSSVPDPDPAARSVVAVVVLGAIHSLLAVWLYAWVIERMGAAKAALHSYLVPPVAIGYGALLLDESFRPIATAGMCVILLGLLLSSRSSPFHRSQFLTSEFDVPFSREYLVVGDARTSRG